MDGRGACLRCIATSRLGKKSFSQSRRGCFTAAFDFLPMRLASQGGMHSSWETETGAAIGALRRGLSDLPQSPGHLFYAALNRLLAENDVDVVEALRVPFRSGVMGRPSIPPGVFFRMTFVSSFEGLSSHRSIA